MPLSTPRVIVPRDKIVKYFAPDRLPTKLLTKEEITQWVIWGVIGLALIPVGIGLLILGVLGAVVWFRNRQQKMEADEIAEEVLERPTDAEIDCWMELDRQVIPEKAVNRGGVDASQLVGEKSILVYGPRLGTDVSLRYRKGQDNRLRFSHYSVTVLMFTQDQLLAYQCVVDHTTGNALNESSSEFFYRFVAGVSIESQAAEARIEGRPKVLQFTSSKTFTLTLSGAQPIRVTLGDPELLRELGAEGGVISASDIDKAMIGIRRMIREKNITSSFN